MITKITTSLKRIRESNYLYNNAYLDFKEKFITMRELVKRINLICSYEQCEITLKDLHHNWR